MPLPLRFKPSRIFAQRSQLPRPCTHRLSPPRQEGVSTPLPTHFPENAETRDRTGDLKIFSLTLSQLSYRGTGKPRPATLTLHAKSGPDDEAAFPGSGHTIRPALPCKTQASPVRLVPAAGAYSATPTQTFRRTKRRIPSLPDSTAEGESIQSAPASGTECSPR